jgi:hypothetical protein
MPQQVCMGASMTCSFGTAPSSLIVVPKNRVNSRNMPAANIMDNMAMVNVMPFAMCTTVTNPAVAAATSAALGVLTPQPCIPVTPAPWTPGSPTVLIGNMPALNNTCTLNCMWGGVISVTNAGQQTVNTA